jgi:hypothetical protein
LLFITIKQGYQKTGKQMKNIAILGGGPSALFLFKTLLDLGDKEVTITIFEKGDSLGSGMPYSRCGANYEHITNVSENEIPALVTSVAEWAKTLPIAVLEEFHIDPQNFNEYKVLPRLFFGMYLSAQFELLLARAKKMGIHTQVRLASAVEDVIDKPTLNETWVVVEGKGIFKFDQVIICTGHSWPKTYEGKVPGFFDSPYPPSKLKLQLNHHIGIRGSSLTAIDAIRTLARNNGTFSINEEQELSYQTFEHCANFKITMHSRSGMLPAVRFHLEDSHLHQDSLLSAEEIDLHIKQHDGFLSLDYFFDQNFKAVFREKDPVFYEKIKDMTIEDFVPAMMKLREELDPFQLLKAEYTQAEKSIKRKESIYWKELLGTLSFSLNYPAKHLSAEDMQRLQKVLLPLISIVIAYVPQSSCEELLALHQAGILEMVTVGDDSKVVPDEENGGAVYHFVDEAGQSQAIHYQTYIDCVGQPHLSYQQFPFKSMLSEKTVSPAYVQFQSQEIGRMQFEDGNEKVIKTAEGAYWLAVSGISINDNFQILDPFGVYNERIYMMAVPYMGGLNPDYSGLDFCEEASGRIVKALKLN